MTTIARGAVIGIAYSVAFVVGSFCYVRGAVLKLRDRVRT